MEPTWSPIGAQLELIWIPLGVQDAPAVQQKDFKGIQKVKIEPERESGHDFERQLGELGSHLEPLRRPLKGHLESRMHLKSRRKVPRTSRKPKSSQNARVSTLLTAVL